MKVKLFPFIIILLAVASCQSNDDIQQLDSCIDTKTNPFKVSMSDVIAYAFDKAGTKTMNEFDISPIISGQDTVMYLINYDSGWEVLSGDTRAPEVLMMCDTGNITADELRLNDGQTKWFERNSKSIEHLLNNPDYVTGESTKSDDGVELASTNTHPWTLVNTSYTTIYDRKVGHLLTTKWGQDDPWNAKMPTYTVSNTTYHCPAGCFNVAMGQMLYYLHSKLGIPYSTYSSGSCNAQLANVETTLVLSSGDVNFPSSSKSSYVWSNMPLTADDDEYTSTNYAYVSTLLLRLGYVFNSEYGALNTMTTSGSRTSPILEDEYEISNDFSSFDYDTIVEQISDGLPVVVNIKTADNEGHSVVADGYRQRKRYYVKTYARSADNGQVETKQTDGYSYDDFLAINWGYDGDGDEYTDGSTIWYNLTENWTCCGHTYVDCSLMFYNFEQYEN